RGLLRVARREAGVRLYAPHHHDRAPRDGAPRRGRPRALLGGLLPHPPAPPLSGAPPPGTARRGRRGASRPSSSGFATPFHNGRAIWTPRFSVRSAGSRTRASRAWIGTGGTTRPQLRI